MSNFIVPVKHQNLFNLCGQILTTFVPNYNAKFTTPEDIVSLLRPFKRDMSQFIEMLLLVYCIEGQLSQKMCQEDFQDTEKLLFKIQNELEVFKSLLFSDKRRLVENVSTQVYS
jgi:hypothetical protein